MFTGGLFGEFQTIDRWLIRARQMDIIIVGCHSSRSVLVTHWLVLWKGFFPSTTTIQEVKGTLYDRFTPNKISGEPPPSRVLFLYIPDNFTCNFWIVKCTWTNIFVYSGFINRGVTQERVELLSRLKDDFRETIFHLRYIPSYIKYIIYNKHNTIKSVLSGILSLPRLRVGTYTKQYNVWPVFCWHRYTYLS